MHIKMLLIKFPISKISVELIIDFKIKQTDMSNYMLSLTQMKNPKSIILQIGAASLCCIVSTQLKKHYS